VLFLRKSSKSEMIGKAKARVFPEPVCEAIKKS